MTHKKAKLWSGKDLKGDWEITIKIDGIRLLVDAAGVGVTRNGKELYNLPTVKEGDYEVYSGSWEDTMTSVRSPNTGIEVPMDHIYSIEDGKLDNRLYYGIAADPTAEYLKDIMEEVVALGFEGLVIRQGDKWLKVKPKETHDVAILGFYAGKGRNLGRLGGFITKHGKVGTGLTDNDRETLGDLPLGTIIEVDCMHMTKADKFRHPRYMRVRHDKTPIKG